MSSSATGTGHITVVLSKPFTSSVPDPAFRAILRHADHNTRLALSQTCARHRTYFTSSAHFAFATEVKVRQGKNVMIAIRRRDIRAAYLFFTLVFVALIQGSFGLYFTFIWYSTPLSVGLSMYGLSVLAVGVGVALLRKLTHKTDRFFRKVRELGGIEVADVWKEVEEMPAWWRFCMK